MYNFSFNLDNNGGGIVYDISGCDMYLSNTIKIENSQTNSDLAPGTEIKFYQSNNLSYTYDCVDKKFTSFSDGKDEYNCSQFNLVILVLLLKILLVLHQLIII